MHTHVSIPERREEEEDVRSSLLRSSQDDLLRDEAREVRALCAVLSTKNDFVRPATEERNTQTTQKENTP